MNTTIKTGDLITWTPWSPMDTGKNFQDFMAFINENTEIEVDDAFIQGEVIYFDELSTHQKRRVITTGRFLRLLRQYLTQIGR